MLKTLVPLISFFVVPLVALAQQGMGGNFNFFGGADIDYWNEGRRTRSLSLFPAPATQSSQSSSVAVPFSGSSIIRANDSKPFNWDDYFDPSKPEMWDDGGDFIPPRIFRETVKDPTPQNIEKYLAVQKEKARLVARFQEALRSHNETNETVATKQKSFDWRATRILYFYQTGCPHCRKDKPIIERINSLGAQVVFVQLDANKNPPLHAGSVVYTEAMERRYAVSATPTWVFVNGTKERTETGFLSFQDAQTIASQL